MKHLSLALLLFSPVAAAQSEDSDRAETATPEARKELDISSLPFTPDSIKMVMEEAQPRIQGCYEELLATTERAVDGKIMTHFVITTLGTVKSAKVARAGTTLRNAKLHQCVVGVLSGLMFPRPPDNKNYPIEFPFNLKAIK